MANMIDIPHMLLIGSTSRESGKTALATKIISRFKDHAEVVGLKVSVIHNSKDDRLRGGNGRGLRTSIGAPFALTRETNETADKDTSKMLAAGAGRAHRLQVAKQHLTSGVTHFLSMVSDAGLIVCESNTIRTVVEPGVFIMTRDCRTEATKISAREVLPFVDRIVTFDGKKQNFATEDLHLDGKGVSIPLQTSALLLAGGNSRRMGSDKALLKANGVSFIERLLRQLDEFFPEVLVSANDSSKYAFLKKRIVTDKHSDIGPIAGIGAALALCAHRRLFVAACDIPELNVDLLAELVSADQKYEVVVPFTPEGFYEPVYAVYDRRVLRGIEELLAIDNNKVIDLYQKHRVLRYPIPASLLNLNTREDYSSYIDSLET